METLLTGGAQGAMRDGARPKGRFQQTLVLLCLSAFCVATGRGIPVVSAQSLDFNEIAIPTNSAYLYVWDRSYYQPGQVVIRYEQQAVVFDSGPYSFTSMRVRLAGGSWTTIYSGSARSGKITWTGALNNPQSGSYEVSYNRTVPSDVVTYQFTLAVVPAAKRAFVRYETVRYPGATVDSTLKHTILLWSNAASGLAQFDKLFLVVEGIDAANETGAEGYYALGASPTGILFPEAQAQGGDIAILNFGDGGRDMRANASVVDAAVTFLRTMNSNPSRSIDVAGVSMGGVVTRYALAKMEQESRLFGVGRFVSIDAPQRGATVDGNLQYDIKNGINPSEVPPALTRVASLQLLNVSAFDTAVPTYNNVFYNEIRSLNGNWGYPRRTENVGVSFGTTATENPNSGTWLKLNVSGLCNIFQYWVAPCNDKYYTLAGATDAPGSYLPVKNTEFFGQRAWGFVSYYLQRFTDPTFISFSSALDIASGIKSKQLEIHSACDIFLYYAGIAR